MWALLTYWLASHYNRFIQDHKHRNSRSIYIILIMDQNVIILIKFQTIPFTL